MSKKKIYVDIDDTICFYKKGVLPTYGKERQDCKKCAGV